jgi:hypothetical protein
LEPLHSRCGSVCCHLVDNVVDVSKEVIHQNLKTQSKTSKGNSQKAQ